MLGTKGFSILSLVINAYEVAHPPRVTASIDPDFQNFDRALKTRGASDTGVTPTIALPGFQS